MSNNPPKAPPPFSAQMPGRDTINNLQITTLLNAINTFMVFLTNARLDASAGREHQSEGKINLADGGSLLAAEQTFVKMCNRLDEIVADESRWSMAVQADLEASLLSVHEAQKEYLRYQQSAIALSKSPHARFYPTLGKLEDGRWAAIFGDPETSQSIIGLGENPEAALADFDEIFDGRHKIRYEQQQSQNRAVDSSGNIIPARKPALNELPGFGRRIKSNGEINRGKTVGHGQEEVPPVPGEPKPPANPARRRTRRK